MGATRIGIVGIGVISAIYLKNITQMFQEIEVYGVCDLVRSKAEKAVEEYNIPKLYNDMQEMFADPDIDLILNLTRPYEHFEVTKAALEAGKNVYSEKPLAASLEEGRKLVALAKEKNLLIGGAPDTFLGAGIQSCRKLIDDGMIGTPIGAAAHFTCRGHERWHEDPEFYYKYGGGPMMDMGPYYITALVNLLGGVKTVTGMTRKTFPQRLITSQPFAGQTIDVDVPTHITGIMEFDSGVVGTIFTTFDVWEAELPRIEIYGSEGTLQIPDPNYFGQGKEGGKEIKTGKDHCKINLFRPGSEGFKEIPLLFPYKENCRGLGLADMAKAIQSNRKHRANSDQTLHVLEILTSFQKSCEERRFIDIESKFTRQKPMEYTMLPGILDD